MALKSRNISHEENGSGIITHVQHQCSTLGVRIGVTSDIKWPQTKESNQGGLSRFSNTLKEHWSNACVMCSLVYCHVWRNWHQ